MTCGSLNVNTTDPAMKLFTSTKLITRSLFLIAMMAFTLPSTSVAQDDDKFGPDPDKCKMNISLYREYFKQKNYDDALPGWRAALAICPKGSKNIYLNGTKLVAHMMEKEEEGSDRWNALRDTMMLVYDMRIEHFGQEGFVLGRKGMDQYSMYDDPQVAYETLNKALDLLGNKMEANSCIRLFQSSLKMAKSKVIERDVVFDLYDKIIPVIDHNLTDGEEKTKKYYQKAKDIVNSNFEKIADCESYIALNKPKIAANPGDSVLLLKVVKFMTKRKCTSDPFFLEASELLYKVDPSADAAYGLYEGYVKKKDYGTAKTFITEAADLAVDNETKADYTFKLANLQYHAKQYAAARTTSNKAASLKPGWGEPYILIADMYYATARSCGSNECDQAYGYWAAADMYSKAKNTDSSVAGKANTGLGKCNAAFPTQEKCFFYSIEKGASVTVGGWIGVTTTARFQ
ncbi:MAG: tetratricopeptide (TPR) repeat protein [Bacteroidia bacterium]|jgi:tetratricopeptide (TPR) repeat protein